MNYIVRIPEPCHEDWNKMVINEKGRYCKVCTKSVIDFTKKTDNEIHNLLKASEGKEVCGRLMKSQINRPIAISISLKDLPSNMSVTKAFAFSLLLVFGTFLISCTNEAGNKIDKIEVEQITQGVMIEPISIVKDSAVSKIQDIVGETMINGGLEANYYPHDSIYEVPEVQIGQTITNDYAVAGGIMYVAPKEEIVPIKDINIDDSLANKVTNQLSSGNLKVYPNPSNGQFTVSYEMKKKERVTILIYAMNGTLIKEALSSIDQHTGHYQIPINLIDLSSGIYSCKLIKGDKEEHQQIIISK